jgi:ADP-heptose:LPS heptosyltransferase
MSAPASPRSILIIRRDNIGDLVLTTPLIRAVRRRFPDSWIALLGNSYNTPVVAGHPDLNEVFAYDKAKHRHDRARVLVYADTARLLLRLRARRIDTVILAGPAPQRQSARLASWLRPRSIIGFTQGGEPARVDVAVPYADGALLHEAVDMFRLGGPLGITGPPGPCVIVADAAQRTRVRAAVDAAGHHGRPVVAIHVSARRPRQRWPAERFVELMVELGGRFDAAFLLLWSPGAEDDPRHPGDDAKAAGIIASTHGRARVVAWPTRSLDQLAGGLAECALMVCADGGAMHMASGLGVPVVALFGDSPVARWHPWGGDSRVLQADSGDVRDIEVWQVAGACAELLAAGR